MRVPVLGASALASCGAFSRTDRRRAGSWARGCRAPRKRRGGAGTRLRARNFGWAPIKERPRGYLSRIFFDLRFSRRKASYSFGASSPSGAGVLLRSRSRPPRVSPSSLSCSSRGSREGSGSDSAGGRTLRSRAGRLEGPASLPPPERGIHWRQKKIDPVQQWSKESSYPSKVPVPKKPTH